MRVVTWNLHAGDTVGKLALLNPVPDVAVLCEVRRQPPPAQLDGTEPSWMWNGNQQDRGIALASWTRHLEIVHPMERRRPGTYAAAAELGNGMGLLGIWSRPEAGTGNKGYADQILASIEAYEELLTSTPCVIAGDFNISPGGDTDRRHGVMARLADLGYISAYHAFHGVEHGSERHPTHFHQFSADKPYHIDLVFLPSELVAKIRSVEVASPDGWVNGRPGYRSDHVPVAVDLDLQ